MLSKPYQPAPQVLRRLREVDFVAVIGPSAVGKTTLIRQAMAREPALRLVLNNTSRAPRPDERQGVDYRFETRARMEQRIALGEYAQVAPAVFGDLYATAAADYATDGVALLPVLADAVADFRALPFKSLRTVYVLPPDWATWQQRLSRHGFGPEKLTKRLAEARRSLRFARDDDSALFVVNDDLDTATDDFVTVTTRRERSARQLGDQARARGLVLTLLAAVTDAVEAAATDAVGKVSVVDGRRP